eukprot:COSAG04_NODE_618_length_11896_cov_81.925659_12_plen_66_part_00
MFSSGNVSGCDKFSVVQNDSKKALDEKQKERRKALGDLTCPWVMASSSLASSSSSLFRRPSSIYS